MTDSEASAGLDWREAKQRLARETAAIRETLFPSAGRIREILEARARKAARVAPPERPPGEMLPALVLHLASERYAIETAYVRAAARTCELTPVPGGPELLAGIARFRGRPLPIFDLRALLGLPSTGHSTAPGLVVLGVERDEFGILADTVAEVTVLRRDEILEPQAAGQEPGKEFLRGFGPGALALLDGAALLASPRLFIAQES